MNLSKLQETVVEKAMATHSSSLGWKIPQTEEPGRLQSMGLQRVGHNLGTEQYNEYLLVQNESYFASLQGKDYKAEKY